MNRLVHEKFEPAKKLIQSTSVRTGFTYLDILKFRYNENTRFKLSRPVKI